MKTIIAVEIDVDPDDELKCGKCCLLEDRGDFYDHCTIPRRRGQLQIDRDIINGFRCQACLDAGTVMMLKTHCMGERSESNGCE